MPRHAFRPDLEFTPPDEIRRHQAALLVEHVQYLARNSRFYQGVFSRLGIDPFSIAGPEDLAGLPVTDKTDLELHTREFLCVSEREVVDICLTSGTTGRPTALMQTSADLDRLGYNEEISFRSAGIAETDRVLIAAAIDRCFMAGLAYFLGLTRVGATAIRAGSSSLPVLMDLVQTHRPTAIVGVPTLMLTMGERLTEAGTDPASLGVLRLVCIGEPVRNQDFSLSALGRRLHELWGAHIFGTYASTEMATTFCECEQYIGGHLHPDLMLLELLDEQGHPVPPGTPGEVVVTPLRVTGMPLLRFKTGDMAVLYDSPCPCGRNSPRLGPILGRKCQLLKIKGTTVYPPAIFAALQEIPQITNFYLEVTDQYALSDHVRVVAGTRDADLTALSIAERIAAKIRIKPEVILTDPESVQDRTMTEGKRKPVIFFDNRKNIHG